MADIRIGTIYNDCGMKKICKYYEYSIADLTINSLEPRNDILVDSTCRILCTAPWDSYTYVTYANVEVCDDDGYPIY